VFVEVAYAFPKLSTTQIGGHYITMEFRVKAAPPVTISTERAELEQWFNILDSQPHQLVAYDTEDTNRPWYLVGIPVKITETGAGIYQVTIALNDPIWRLETPSTTGDVSVTTNPQAFALTVMGNVPAKQIITIKPTTPRTGSYGYRRYVLVYNGTAVPFPYAVSSNDITAGGINTAALVAGGKMLANGDDCRVFVDGVDVNRWFGGSGINSTVTTIWCNIPHSAGAVGTLRTALPNNGTTVNVVFTKNKANLVVLKAFAKANNRAFLIGSEVLTFNKSSDVDLTNYRINNCSRAQKGTSFAGHSIGVSITWIEHDVWLVYGNSAAGAPSTNDAKKPLIDLTLSTNGQFVWSQFYDNTSTRPLAWKPSVLSSITNGLSGRALSNYYTADQGDFANPASEMGMQMQSYNHNAVHRAETAVECWTMYHPAGFTVSSMAGKKYLLKSAGVWPANAGLQKSVDNINFVAVWNEAVPTINTWTAFTHNAVSLGAAAKQYVRLIFGGSIAAGAGNIAYLQGDSVTLALGANTLSVSLLPEAGNYLLDAAITNSTSGETLYVYGVMGTNQTLTIDCAAKTCTLSDGTPEFNMVSLSDGRINPDWLDIGQDTNNKFTGVANLSYASNGVVAETVNITWADSSY
jgi:hypothetical protein